MNFALLVTIGYLATANPRLVPAAEFLLALQLLQFYVFAWQITSWPCPRCSHRFFSRYWLSPLGYALPSSACVNCGLPWKEARKAPYAPA